jgi:hypothetical protein
MLSEAHQITKYTGSSPFSGRVTALAVDPTNSNVAYVGGAAGGVWKTTDGGTTWSPTFDSQTALAVGAIAIDPQNHNTIWVGTGEPNLSEDTYFGDGLYKSTSGGSEWTKVGGSTFAGCYTADLVIKPTDSNTVLVAVQKNGRYSTTCAQGVYRTTNGGAEWSKVSSGNCRPTDIAVDPNNSTVWYAGFSTNVSTWGTTPTCSNGALPGVYKSKDSGATFQAVGSGLYQTGVLRVAVTVAPSNSQRVYVATAVLTTEKEQPQRMALQTSTDGGQSWSGFLPYSTNLSGQLEYDLSLAADPTDSSIFYLGGVFLFKYTESGSKYTEIGAGADETQTGIHVDQHAAVFDGAHRLWLGSDGGAYRTADGGVTFANLNANLGITEFEPGAAGSLGSKFVAGTQDNGFNAYTGSAAWNRIATLGDAGYSAIDSGNSNIIYGTYPDTSNSPGVHVEKTTNGGASYTEITTTIPTSEPAEFYYPLVMSVTNSQVLYVGTNRVWRSENGGGSWIALSKEHFTSTVSAIAPAPSNASVIYAGVSNGNLEVTTNGGASWTNTAVNGLPTAYITDLWVDPANPAVAYASLSGFGHGHLFKTSDSGTHWTDASGDLPNTPTNAVALDTRTTTLYVGTDVGVFASTDGGVSWQHFTGLPNVVVMDLKLDLVTNQLVALTHGRGAWKLPVSVASPTVTKVSPAKGLVDGGTTVTITGTNFTGATTVKFGSVNASSFTVKSETTITAVSPAEAAGTVDVRVTTPAGTSAVSSVDRFKFFPTVSKVVPSEGPVAGGTSVTVTGKGFVEGATVIKFGSTTASSKCSSWKITEPKHETTCTVVAPAHAAGIVDVRATVNKVTSAKTSADRFSYF